MNEVNLTNVEKQIINCNSLSELNDLSRKISKTILNINHLVKNKRIELMPKEEKQFDRKRTIKDLNKLMER